jgi:probable rRNA maturation factor
VSPHGSAPRAAAAAPAVEISLAGLGRFPGAADRRLAPWLRRLVGALAPGAASFDVRFVGDRAMRALNREFRGIDRSTDVLSFPGGETQEGTHLGDVVVSLPYARRQAATNGHSLETELRMLLLHGVLHCLGHDHETDDGEMERLERRLRRKWIAASSGAPVTARSSTPRGRRRFHR